MANFSLRFINANVVPKTIDLTDIDIETFIISDPVFNFSLADNSNPINTHRNKTIPEHLRIDHLNTEARELITNLCLKLEDNFYIDGDNLTLKNEIKHFIETGNS